MSWQWDHIIQHFEAQWKIANKLLRYFVENVNNNQCIGSIFGNQFRFLLTCISNGIIGPNGLTFSPIQGAPTNVVWSCSWINPSNNSSPFRMFNFQWYHKRILSSLICAIVITVMVLLVCIVSIFFPLSRTVSSFSIYEYGIQWQPCIGEPSANKWKFPGRFCSFSTTCFIPLNYISHLAGGSPDHVGTASACVFDFFGQYAMLWCKSINHSNWCTWYLF